MPQWPALTKPPPTAKPTEHRTLPLITYWSPPRVSYIGRGASAEVTTRTAPAPDAAAKDRAAAVAPDAARTTTLFEATSTCQPRTDFGTWDFAGGDPIVPMVGAKEGEGFE